MSRFMSRRHAALQAYVPGEQPRNMQYIKLNTNESPFPPSQGVLQAVRRESEKLHLYSDPECTSLIEKAASFYGVGKDQLLMTNGSDEILNFAFMAFGDAEHPFAFPSITYGFYPVFAQLNGIPFRQIPLKADFSIDPKDYEGLGMNIVIANPNAPTGLILSPDHISRIAAANPDNVVIVDEAYIDFGGDSCIPLLSSHDNLLITRTFSKSFSMAGARLGFGIGSKALMADLNAIKYSTNPYNVNRMTMAAGVAALEEAGYYLSNCQTIIENREYAKSRLREMGFCVTDSRANFLFAAHDKIGGGELYRRLREAGILVRHFSLPEIESFNRITVGTRQQMDALLAATETILKEENAL